MHTSKTSRFHPGVPESHANLSQPHGGIRCSQSHPGLEAHWFPQFPTSSFPHFHDAHEVVAAEGGAMYLKYKQKKFLVPQGSLAILPPRLVHALYPVDFKPLTLRVVHLNQTALEQVLGEENGQRVSSQPLGISVISQPALVDRFLWQHRVLFDPNKKVNDFSQIAKSVADLVVHWLDTYRSTSEPTVEHAAILTARQCLESDLAKRLSLDEIAEITGMSKFHMARLFTRSVGISPHTYRLQARVIAAKKMLRRGIRPADAASGLGFADVSHLGRYFKRSEGFTPGVYAAASP
jgi:AraC-like DNA-binding protein/mannose-6-phosphate isomerase-like protein (cupin superfamily)